MPDLCGQDLSELLLGRPDHALLVSMWACLYGKVRVSRDTVREAMAQVDLADEVAEYKTEHGVPPHPKALIDQVVKKFADTPVGRFAVQQPLLLLLVCCCCLMLAAACCCGCSCLLLDAAACCLLLLLRPADAAIGRCSRREHMRA